MLDTYFKISFMLIMVMSVIAIVGFIPLLLIQSFIYKKIFDPVYFNENHFSSYELSIFNSFPLLLIKTLVYIRAIIFPSTMLKRFNNYILTNKNKPIIYTLALLSILILIFGAAVIINTGIVGVLIYLKD